MSSVILNLIAAPVRGTAIKPADPAAISDSPEAKFGHLLAVKLQAVTVKSVRGKLNAVAASPATLAGKIDKLLRGGASQTDIIAKLAASLAATVATKLGARSAQTEQQLRAVFARALAPPAHTGAARTLTESAHSLAQRFKRIEKLAVAVAADSSGQLNQLAGTFLDAGSAKETPVPAPTTPLDRISAANRNASAGTAGAPATPVAAMLPAHAALPESAAALVPVLTAAASAPDTLAGLTVAAGATFAPQTGVGDGRRVKVDDAAAVGANGDTALGRVLTRATLAADARQAVNFAVATARSSADPTGSAKPHSAETAVSAFVKAFELAVSLDHDAVSPAIAPLAPPAAAVPAVFPFRIEPLHPAAAPVTAAHTPPADQSAIADQVLRGIVMRTTGASSEMRLSLKPETLGEVNVKLIVTAGSVTAHVVADTPEVRDALVAAQPQLSKSLADAGLKLDGLTVDLSGNGFAGFAGRDGDRAPARDSEQSASAIGDGDAGDATLDAIPSFAPATAGAGDYNYLA